MKTSLMVLGSLLTCVLINGCTSTRSVKAKPLHPTFVGQGVDLSKYNIVTVVPFQVPNSRAANDDVGRKLATDIANRLEYDFGPLFQTVRVGQPLGAANELVVTGIISDYRPGSRAERLLGPGIGKADLKGELDMRDGPTGQQLIVAPIDKLWAWGHSVGAMKGMSNMLEETAASAANLVARSRGWVPQHQAALAH